MFVFCTKKPKTTQPKSKKAFNFVCIGLDNAGKTSLLNRITKRTEVQTFEEFNFEPPSTCGFNLRAFSFNKQKLTIYDCGGKKQFRELWEYYCQDVDGLIYVIDASDPDRLEESGIELINILRNPVLGKKPLLILANKTDKEGSLSPEELCEFFGFKDIVDRDWYITKASSVKDLGLDEGLQWLYSNCSNMCY